MPIGADRDQSAGAGAGAFRCMAAAAAWSISVRLMRRNATGAAVRPTSPQSQNAQWNPPVSASAMAWPWPSRTRERAAATADATAIPIAPPSCWDGSISPEATPASRSVTPTRAPIDTHFQEALSRWPCERTGPAMTEATLARAQAGDGEAFRELVDPCRRELQAHCYRILGSVQDAEDVLQEALLARRIRTGRVGSARLRGGAGEVLDVGVGQHGRGRTGGANGAVDPAPCRRQRLAGAGSGPGW